MQQILNLHFYNPRSDPVNLSWLVNNFVSFMSGPFCHVELEFPGYESCSIVMGSAVLWRQRSFDKNYYTCLSITTAQNKYQHAYNICKRHFNAKTRFGMSTDNTYCSRLVVDILVESQIIPATLFANYNIIFPSQIYNKISQEKNGQVSCHTLQNSQAKKQSKNLMRVSGSRIVAIDFNNQFAHHLNRENACVNYI